MYSSVRGLTAAVTWCSHRSRYPRVSRAVPFETLRTRGARPSDLEKERLDAGSRHGSGVTGRLLAAAAVGSAAAALLPAAASAQAERAYELVTPPGDEP